MQSGTYIRAYIHGHIIPIRVPRREAVQKSSACLSRSLNCISGLGLQYPRNRGQADSSRHVFCRFSADNSGEDRKEEEEKDKTHESGRPVPMHMTVATRVGRKTLPPLRPLSPGRIGRRGTVLMIGPLKGGIPVPQSSSLYLWSRL